MNCTRPLDALDLEAIASGEEPVVSPDARGHVALCPDCAARVDAFRAFGEWLSELPLPPIPEAFAAGIERRRPFSIRERRSIGLWKTPALAFAGLAAASAAMIALPAFGAADQAGFLAAIGFEWKAAMFWPAALVRALPASVTALSDILLRDRGFAALSILLMLPAGFGVSRLWARRAAGR